MRQASVDTGRRTGRLHLLGAAFGTGLFCALAGCASPARLPASEPPSAAPGGVPTGFVPALPPPVATRCTAGPGGREPAPATLERQLDPLDAPALFTRHFFPEREEGEHPSIDLGAAHYRTLAQWADEASGLHTALLLNPENGHGILMFRGVTRIGSDPGGLSAFLSDSKILLAAKSARQNPQLLAGEAFFHRARCEPEVRSLEIIGYSLGSQVANALAVRQRAVGTVFGDMGVDISIIERDAQPDKAALRQELKQHLSSLRLSGDLLVRVYAVGETIGERIDLPGGVVGLLHQPEIYVNSANLARGVPVSP